MKITLTLFWKIKPIIYIQTKCNLYIYCWNICVKTPCMFNLILAITDYDMTKLKISQLIVLQRRFVSSTKTIRCHTLLDVCVHIIITNKAGVFKTALLTSCDEKQEGKYKIKILVSHIYTPDFLLNIFWSFENRRRKSIANL